MARMERSRADRRRRIVKLGLMEVAGLAFLAGLLVAWNHLQSDPLGDVRAYYDAGARLNHGQPLYDQPATTNESAFYRYPPLLAIIFRPLALLPFEVAAVVWELVVIASLGATLYRLGLRRPSTWIAFGLLGIAIGWAVTIGQAHVPVTFLMALGTPFGLALAGQLKLFPAVAAIWWLGRGDWGSLGRFAAWTLALVLVQIVLEPSGSLAYPGTLSLAQVGEVRNISPYAISPALWAVLAVAGTIASLWLARSERWSPRWSWPAAVALATLVSPRLLTYQLMTFLAAVRRPDDRDG
jgi:hypothetical protein